MDVAASEFYTTKDGKKYSKDQIGKYDLAFKDATDFSQIITGKELLKMYKGFIKDYPMVSIEDPFDEKDFDSYGVMTRDVGKEVQIVGDDLLVTNPTRVQIGIDQEACNALLLKVNQIGTVTESIEAWKMSVDAGWGVMVSHRSGETEDNFIADLVVGLGTGEIKTGAPCRSERLSKYNQLLRIEQELGDRAVYAGKLFRDPSSLID